MKDFDARLAGHREEKVVLQVPITLAGVRLAAAAIKGITETVHGLDDTCQVDVVVAEVGNNVVLHGHGKSASRREESRITITVETMEDGVILIFEDEGPPFDPVTTPAGTPEQSIAKGGGGLGLFIIKQIMDELSYERVGNRNVLRLVKYAPKSKEISQPDRQTQL